MWWIIAALVLVGTLLTLRVIVPAVRQLRLIAAIEALGGQADVDHGGYIPAWLGRTVFQRFGRGLFPLAHVYLNDSSVDDRWLARLGGMSELQTLNLEGTGVTSGGMGHVGKLRELRSLGLSGTKLDDEGLAHLAALEALENLALGYTGVTDAGLAHIAGHTGLHYLGLRGDGITNAGLAHLRGLVALRELQLAETRVSDAGLGALADMGQLGKQWLAGSAVTEAGVLALAPKLPALRWLYLSPDQITADGIDELRRLHSQVHVTILTDEGDGTGFNVRQHGPANRNSSENAVD